MARTRVSKHALSWVNHGYITGKSRVVENPGFVQKLPQTRVLGANHGYITVITRVNHGFIWVWGWKQTPPPDYLQKKWKNMQSVGLNVIICYHFRCGPQKNHEKRLLQTAPMLVKSNEQSLNVKFIWISSHRQKIGEKKWFWPKTGFSGVSIARQNRGLLTNPRNFQGLEV